MSRIVQFLYKLEKEKKDANEAEKLKELQNVHEKSLADSLPVSTNLIPIASGKGGVGKTNFSVNIALALAEELHHFGKTVVLMDCDFGLPNADLLLGVRPQFNIHHFLKRRTESLAPLLSATRYPGLMFLSGSPDAPLSLANLNYMKRQKFMKHIQSLRADYVLMDLGASAHYEILDFFSMTNTGILVVNPEPTSMRDVFLFLKNCIFRKFMRELRDQPDILDLVRKLEDPDNTDIVDMGSFIDEVGTLSEGISWMKVIKTMLANFTPNIVMNRILSVEEGVTAMKNLKDETFRYLNIKLNYLGGIFHDDKVVKAVKLSLPIYTAFPESKAVKSIIEIKKILLNNKEFELEKNYFSFGDYLIKLFRQKPETEF